MGAIIDLDLTERYSWKQVLDMIFDLCGEAADLSFDHCMIEGRRMVTMEIRLDAPAELSLPQVVEDEDFIAEKWARGTVVFADAMPKNLPSDEKVWLMKKNGAGAVNYRCFKDMVGVMTAFEIPCEFAWSSYPTAPLCDDTAKLNAREKASYVCGAVHTLWAHGSDEAVKERLLSMPACGEIRVQNMTTANTWIKGECRANELAEAFGMAGK